MRCVVYRGVGGPEVVAVEERPDPAPGRFEVAIEPAFAGVNPADVLQREGKHPVPAGAPKDVPGLEVGGRVVECGEGVTAFAEGDRAFGLVSGGGLAGRVIAHERELFAVPDALDDRAAAAAPEAFLTAFDAICLQAGLGSGDTLLVNGASGGVGTAAVQIAVHLGARVVANVRSEALRPRVAELGATALGADAAFAHVQEEGGADVVLELVGAPHMAANVASLARGGRIIVVGARPGDEATIALRDLMSRRGRLMGTTLRTRPLEEKAYLVQEFGRRIVPAMAAGRVRPIVDRAFPLDEAVAALDHVRAPGKFGKVLLDLADRGG
jgi:NADPH:quinone reductase